MGRFSLWLAALLGIVAIKAVLSLSVESTSFVYSYSGISYLLLLLLAAGFSIQNGIRRTLRARPFWLLLAAGCGLWAFHQFLDLYYELGLHIEVPGHSIADEILFFHLVPFLAAVATLPNLHLYEVKQHRWILNTLLILGFWAFLYGFTVAPYKYIQLSPSTDNGARFDVLYLVENLALILILMIVALRARAPWKTVYLHLLCASTLYALSSTVANLAIDAGGYVNGKLYGFGLTASVCWLVWVPLSARAIPESEADTLPLVDKQDSQVSAWAMLAVVMISLPMAWELFHRDENANIRTLRLIVASAAIVLLACGAYLKEYLDRRELAWSFNRRLIQAQEEERIRIARELHDDLCQRMALLSIRLGQLKASPDGLPEETQNQLSKMQKEAAEISISIQQVSHELHSSTLELLGLSGAARSWCGELSEKRKIEISFGNHDVPTILPSEISLNLFRVLQEALNNAAKYSGARRFDVRLWGTPAEIHLKVTDRGKGFDISAAMRGQGLGLKSMRERVKLMNGHLTIESKPNRGTTIHARVPVDFDRFASLGIQSA
ncbi:MAG TPA: sensor histidine kinase [Terracidiphilus sp.]|nr:sensor histidine kinase [Terracidiphilus sp.]